MNMLGLLGDGWDDPRSAANMALAAGLLRRDLGAGLLGANEAFSQAKQGQAKQKYMDAQMQELQSQIEARKLAAEQAARKQRLIDSLLGGGAPAQPGQLGSGSFDIMPTAVGVPSIPTGGRSARIPSLDFDQLGALKMYGVDLVDLHKYANDPRKLESGSTYESRVTGQREYMPRMPEGATMAGGRMAPVPGYTDTLTATTLATEAPKTLLQSAGRVNLRANADGTQSPVSELSENPTLQNVLGGVFGGRSTMPFPSAPSAPQRPMAAPQGIPPQGSPGRPVVSPNDQRGADAESIRMIQAELQNPNLSPQERAGMQRELARLQQAQGQPGFPRPSMIRNPQGYGKTTEQQAAEEVAATEAKTRAELRVKDLEETRKNIVAAGFSAPQRIAKYQQLGTLLADVDGGKLTATGTNLASAMNSLGLKVDKNLPNKEAAAALGNEMALQLRNPAAGAGMPGAMSDKDREFLVGMIPNASQSLEGRKMLIQAQIALAQREQQVATFMRNYEKKYGKLDNGFFEQMQAWADANPLFKGQ